MEGTFKNRKKEKIESKYGHCPNWVKLRGFPGGYLMHLKPPVMCHMSHVLCLVSHNTFQPFPNHKSNFRKIFTIPYVSCVLCQMSGVTCPLWRVTCHLWHVTCHVTQFFGFIYIYIFFYKLMELVGEWSVINGAYLF